MEFIGREEIDEVGEDSIETGRQTVHCSRPEKTLVDCPVDWRRDRSTGQSTDVHGVHKYSLIDRGMEQSTARSTD